MPKAAAVFKHAVLDQYLKPYAMKVGLRAPHRVAFVDAYAGPGMYEDGTKGSPARVLDTASAIADKRHLECHFIEKQGSFIEKLRAFASEHAGEIPIHVYDGDIMSHLDALIARTSVLPTLVFLDPFGLVIPFESIRRILRRPAGAGQPGVEVLINFSTVSLRRIAGMLTSSTPVQATLERMNEVCGGTWWQEMWLHYLPDTSAAELAVTAEYARRLAGTGPGSYGWWAVDVKNRPGHLPMYYLVFLTRHRDGLSLFGESSSLALEKWRQKIHSEDNAEDTLFGTTEEALAESERALAESWTGRIESNLRRLLSSGQGFSIAERYSAVFDGVVGEAREKHLRTAWNRLYEEGETSTNPKGKKLLKIWIMPPRSQ